MSNQLTAPAVENVKMREATLNIWVDMDLASVPVSVKGQYNIHSNCFYPSIVDCKSLSVEEEDLEAFCERMDWDYLDTQDLIQDAVERRDQ